MRPVLTRESVEQTDLKVERRIPVEQNHAYDDNVKDAKAVRIVRPHVRPLDKVQDAVALQEPVDTQQWRVSPQNNERIDGQNGQQVQRKIATETVDA